MSTSTSRWDETYDLVIVGSGAASIPAALLAKDAGKSVLIVEKTDKIGGSTAMSGGVIWIPDNPVLKREGVADSYEKAKAYLDACAGPYEPGSTPERRHTFLTEGPRLIAYLESKGMKFICCRGWPDYHEGEYPGGVDSRSLCAPIYSLKRLGRWRERFRTVARPPIHAHEGTTLYIYGRTLRSKLKMLEVGWRLIQNRLGRDLAGTGSSLQGRLLEIAIRHEIPFWTNAPVVDFVEEGARVAGVVVEKDGRRLRIQARAGVLVNAGGFSHNQAMRNRYHPQPSSTEYTLANPGDTGEAIQMAERLGAALNYMDLSWYNPISKLPNGGLSGNLREVALPHAIYVDSAGSRFTNEATSYVQIGLNAFERQKTAVAQPSWAIFDATHRRSYIWAGSRPGRTPPEWIDNGYMIQASTLDDLARKCGIDPAGLKTTVERFNGFARKGVDEDYHRGESGMGRHLQDPSQHPNGCLGAVETPPFYAVQIWQGDVGTAGGIVTDEHGRVMHKDGGVIEGLYATGNSTAPVVGRSYPGAGASIANSAVFGFCAARHALALNSLPAMGR